MKPKQSNKKQFSPSEIREYRKSFLQKFQTHSAFFDPLLHKSSRKVCKYIATSKVDNFKALFNLIDELLSTRFLKDRGISLVSKKYRRHLKETDCVKELVNFHSNSDNEWTPEAFKKFILANETNAKSLRFMLKPFVLNEDFDDSSDSGSSSSETSSDSSNSEIDIEDEANKSDCINPNPNCNTKPDNIEEDIEVEPEEDIEVEPEPEEEVGAEISNAKK